MKVLRFLLVAVVAAFTLAACDCGSAKCDKRAAKIVEEIRNPQSKNVLVICHRGDWRNFPENSIPAIESVIAMGADIVELDIALTKDSVLVLSHDRSIDRCTTGRGAVSDYTYEELQKFYLKTAHGIRCSLDLKMPTLREAMEVCKDRIVINIDKGYNHYDLVVAMAEELGMPEQVLIKGSGSLSDIRQKMGQFDSKLLFMPVISPSNASNKALMDEYLADSEPQLAYEICWNEYTPVVEDAMKRVIADGSKLWVNSLWNSLCGGLSDDVAWVTSAEEVYGKLVDMGATMIQTDRPEYLLEYLRSRGLHD
ncbi:MAG: glycerophosphodiester phosphodiesterase family protein [Alistipes sp.]|nr:glycerophosphodiester phosphodiesterase family protein [Alistipes sp.]